MRILTQPFQQAGLWLPLATVALGVYRHLLHAHPAWLGSNSLALLLAAGFYFWRDILNRSGDYRSLSRAFLESDEYKNRPMP